jgi:hypothetical protein
MDAVHAEQYDFSQGVGQRDASSLLRYGLCIRKTDNLELLQIVDRLQNASSVLSVQADGVSSSCAAAQAQIYLWYRCC